MIVITLLALKTVNELNQLWYIISVTETKVMEMQTLTC